MEPWALSSPAPATSLACLGLVAADCFHLLRAPAPDAAFVPETDRQTGVPEAPHPLPWPKPSLPGSLQSAPHCEAGGWDRGQGLGTGTR